jgi:hypothetical protein
MMPSSAQVDYMRIRVSFHGAGFARERVNVLHMTDSVNMPLQYKGLVKKI